MRDAYCIYVDMDRSDHGPCQEPGKPQAGRHVLFSADRHLFTRLLLYPTRNHSLFWRGSLLYFIWRIFDMPRYMVTLTDEEINDPETMIHQFTTFEIS